MRLADRFANLQGQGEAQASPAKPRRLTDRLGNLSGQLMEVSARPGGEIRLSAKLGQLNGPATLIEAPAGSATRLAQRLQGLQGSTPAMGIAEPDIRLSGRLGQLQGQTRDADPAQRPRLPTISERMADMQSRLPALPPMEDVYLPFGEWLPDLLPYQMPAGGLVDCKNVVPVAGGYAPINGAVEYSTSELNERPQGAFACQDDDGNVYHFAGDDTDLFTLTDLSTLWVNTSSTVGTYSTGSDMLWSFTKYGEDVIASNYADPIQKYTMAHSATTDFADLNASDAPDAYYVETVREFLFAANTNDSADGHQPGRIWWSAQGDHTSWPTPGTAAAAAAQSDFNDFSDLGEITGLVSGVGFADVVILQQGGIRIGNYIGPKAIFRFDVVKAARGCIAPASVIVQNGKVYYLSDLGFMELNGSSARPIALNRIGKTFADDIDPTYYYRMSAAADPVNPLLIWCVTTDDSTAGLPYKLYIYNWSLDRWSYALCANIGGVEFVYGAYKLASVEGEPILGVFIDDAQATHDSGFLTGNIAACVIETGDYSGNGRRLDVAGFRLLGDATQGSEISMKAGHRETQVASVTYISESGASRSDGVINTRCNARYVRAQIYGLSVSAGSWSLLHGVEVMVQKVEKRDSYSYTEPA